MVEYGVLLEKGFQLGVIHAPAWVTVPIAIGALGFIVIVKVIAAFLSTGP